MKTPVKTPSASRRYWILLIASILAIATHFLLRWTHISAFHTVAVENIPLLAVILFGGIPLAFQILKKMLKGDFGADMLTILAIATGAWLGEYLASALIILMLSGGQALEAYAMRKASSVLSALAERMPSIAHRKNGTKVEEVALSDITIGDEIIVFPHETAPVDGVVIEGHGSMDESYFDG